MLDSLMRTYARLPVSFERGEGPYLWDTEGNRYLDALGGIAVCALGHAHPAVTEAIRNQAGRLLHCSNLYRVPVQESLGERLSELTGNDAVFFCNSGAEANEAAIKLARLHASQRGIGDPAIMVMEGAFHGRTMATLTATGSRKARAGFEPLLPGFVRVPFGDLNAARRAASNTPGLIAVMVEPIQGEGGIVTPPAGYLKGLRELCDERDLLLICDEIQSGMGRTGQWLAASHEGVSADVTTLAKALGNGVPIGACLARGAAADVLQPGTHGSTFGGNPLASSAALAVLETIESEGLLNRASSLGQRIEQGLRDRLGEQPAVEAIRGSGLMIGIELREPCGVLVERALERGLLINVTAERVIRLLPPYILTDEQADEIADTVSALVLEFCGTGSK
ncbi:aspartate aminotransferase family protein [Ectothiorhodospiraceae bacterium WFHF3C12]|nr:aspartate aminotransferase family protein [Ectothiorhodospiraceae bacterium WFHF3C12]